MCRLSSLCSKAFPNLYFNVCVRCWARARSILRRSVTLMRNADPAIVLQLKASKRGAVEGDRHVEFDKCSIFQSVVLVVGLLLESNSNTGGNGTEACNFGLPVNSKYCPGVTFFLQAKFSNLHFGCAWLEMVSQSLTLSSLRRADAWHRFS